MITGVVKVLHKWGNSHKKYVLKARCDKKNAFMKIPVRAHSFVARLVLAAVIGVIAFLGAGFNSYADQYMVGAGDVLKIEVYDHDDLTTVARVNGDGTITMPLLGQLDVNRLTVSQISELLSARLEDGYIIAPQVSVFIEEFRSKKVIILGQVHKPGLYELQGQTTLLELISKAGGLTEDAGEKVILKRKPTAPGYDESVINIDMKKLVEQGDASLNVTIIDGDSIYISKAGVFYVTGEVKKPDMYKYEAITVIKAITMAGGLTDRASARNVKIIRKIDGREDVLEKVKMDESVLPGDVVVVPESFF